MECTIENYGKSWKYIEFMECIVEIYMNLQEDVYDKYYEISGDTLGKMSVKCIWKHIWTYPFTLSNSQRPIRKDDEISADLLEIFSRPCHLLVETYFSTPVCQGLF